MAELTERCWHEDAEPDDYSAHWATCPRCGAHLHNRNYEPGGCYANYCTCPPDAEWRTDAA